MRRFLFLLLAATLIVPVAAGAAMDHPFIALTNATGHWIYVDTYEPFHIKHEGFVESGGKLGMEMSWIGTSTHFDIHVYVKKSRTEDARETICSTMKTFPGIGHYFRKETVHYDGKTCWIASD